MLSGLGQVAAQAQERAYEWGWSSVSWQELVTRRSPTQMKMMAEHMQMMADRMKEGQMTPDQMKKMDENMKMMDEHMKGKMKGKM
jgi:hypothetical protein